MKEKKYQYFIRVFHYWCGRLKVPKPIDAIKDNRMDCPYAIDNWQYRNKICLKYNTRRMAKKPKCVLISDVFHEIGHLINNLPYRTQKQKIYSEYCAEKFSFQMMKKFYPKQYRFLCCRLKEKKRLKLLKREEPLYYEAYKRIKEWQED